MDWSWWLILVAAVLSAFFALHYYVLGSVRRATLEELAKRLHCEGLFARLERHLPWLRLAASFGRVASNLCIVLAMMNAMDISQHGPGRMVLALLNAGVVIVIAGMVVPHALVASAGPRIVLASLLVLLFFRYLFAPFLMIQKAFEPPARGFSADEAFAVGGQARQEVLQAAAEGSAEGQVRDEEVKMIASVMSLSDIDTARIMTPRTDVFALPVETSWADACRQVVAAGHSRVPLYEGDIDNITGVLYAKDLLAFADQTPPENLRAIARKPYFVPETKSLPDLLREFKSRKVHVAIVVDEYGGTAGLVSIEDVLEEIVGDIRDEYDHPQPALMKRTGPRSAEVDGRLLIVDLNVAMGLRIPKDENYDTVAGLVFAELGYIPTAGEKLQAHGATFTVLVADERKITKLRIEESPSPPRRET